MLMEIGHIDEDRAWRALRGMAERECSTMADAAETVVAQTGLWYDGGTDY
jgi:AmiR/NasT family two-component response regulator